MGVVSAISDAVNIREDGLRLLLSVLAGYPLATIHRSIFYNKSAHVQHLFFVTVGIFLYLFNYGYAIYHSLFSIALAFVITNFLAGTQLSVILAHVGFLGHLLVGYWFAESSEYDITWTTPFCIMSLRFIGLVMDVYDGQQPKASLKPDQLKTAIHKPPGLLEIAAYGYFFAGTFVGPQFTLSRFRAFVGGEFLDEKTGAVRTSSTMASCQRFVAGVFYAVIFQWGTLWVPDTFFNSPEFFALPFHWKVIWNTIWFRATMYRYVMMWLLTEGVTILCGMGYNGRTADGEERWDGLRDIHINKFELGSDFTSVIESFNCGTNAFAKNHLFRRLKWLGNKYYSHAVTLFYLAVWHGYHLGYFLLFATEFMCIVAQEQLYSLVSNSDTLSTLVAHPVVKPLTWLFGRVMINISMAYAFLTFGLLKKEIWIGPVTSMYCWGHIFYFLVWPLAHFTLLKVLPRKRKTSKCVAPPLDEKTTFGEKKQQ